MTYRLSLILILLSNVILGSCASIADEPDSLTKIELLFPQKNVVVSDRFETFPISFRTPDGPVAVSVSINGKPSVTEVGEAVQRIDIPLETSKTTVKIGPAKGTGPVWVRTITRLPVNQVEALSRTRKQEDANFSTGEGRGAIDLIASFPFIYIDDEPPYIYVLPPEVFCGLDVDVHKPISLVSNEPLIDETVDFNLGATTLRNDDGDWVVGRRIAQDTLPVAALQTDIDQTANANENDLIKIDAHNAFGLPNVYLFAFPTHAEADRTLGRQVRPIGGRHANANELGYFSSATKAAPVPGLPRQVPAGMTSFWVEAKLGGRYRFVIGILPQGGNPAAVRYVRNTATTNPVLGCMRQATMTGAVIDIFQGTSPMRQTAFDVYWGGRPYFRAEVWPGGSAYRWGQPYKLGANPVNMEGTAVDGKVASMDRDTTEGEPSSNATYAGETVASTGAAPGNFTRKGRITGGFQMDSPRAGNVPTVNRAAGDRYPKRVSLEYTVNGEKLVRPEHLEVILPQLAALPAAQLARGNNRSVASSVNYTISDAFTRTIRATTRQKYLEFYGAGLKAWEALGMPTSPPPAPIQEGGRRNDTVRITSIGAGLAILPVGTAQRSQARVRLDRMTAGTFTDTLRFNARGGQNARFQDWKVWTSNTTLADVNASRAAARARVVAYQQAAGNLTALAALRATDDANRTAQTVFSIRQDVILQLRIGDTRHDLNALQNNRLALHPPFYFESFPGGRTSNPFVFHLTFTPGNAVSTLVGTNHLRTPP